MKHDNESAAEYTAKRGSEKNAEYAANLEPEHEHDAEYAKYAAKRESEHVVESTANPSGLTSSPTGAPASSTPAAPLRRATPQEHVPPPAPRCGTAADYR